MKTASVLVDEVMAQSSLAGFVVGSTIHTTKCAANVEDSSPEAAASENS